VPDANTIWVFREVLKCAGAVDRLCVQFDATLRAAGYLAMGGQIVDSTIVAAPKQRNTEAECAASKAGNIPAGQCAPIVRALGRRARLCSAEGRWRWSFATSAWPGHG
jgi:hypothetical protein